MNERLKELKRKATEHAYSVTTLTETSQEWDMLVSEKFAELIVREHIRLAHEQLNGFRKGQVFVEIIKEHFGVEE